VRFFPNKMERPQFVTLHSSFSYDSASRLQKVIGHSITNTYAYATNRPLLSSLDQGGVQGVSCEDDELK
jgi:hypothetical protein